MEHFCIDADKQTIKKKPAANQSGLSGWFIKKNIVRTKSQAFLLLLGIIAVCVIAIVYINWHAGASEEIDDKYYQDVILEE